MRWLLLALLLVACKGKEPKVDTKKSTFVVDMPACKKAFAQAATAPLDARSKILLDGCRVCAPDWQPLLGWNLEPEKGGPKRELVQQIMEDCEAFCSGDSKLKFMSGVDKARGMNVDTPWRLLAKTCKDKVNAAADERFMSAPFFALDRVARTLAKGGATADVLGTLELPLPALTISGGGVNLPDAQGVMPVVGPLHITVLGDAIYIGRLPRGTLTANGVTAELGPTGYPGEQVKVEELGAKLTALVGDQDKTQPITLLAPSAMPAQKLVPIIAAASAVSPVHLGASASESPTGWQLPAAIPIDLEAGKDVEVTGEMKVQDLATELAGRAAQKQAKVGIATK